MTGDRSDTELQHSFNGLTENTCFTGGFKGRTGHLDFPNHAVHDLASIRAIVTLLIKTSSEPRNMNFNLKFDDRQFI